MGSNNWLSKVNFLSKTKAIKGIEGPEEESEKKIVKEKSKWFRKKKNPKRNKNNNKELGEKDSQGNPHKQLSTITIEDDNPLRETVEDLERKVSDLHKVVQGLKSVITNLVKSVENLETRVAHYENVDINHAKEEKKTKPTGDEVDTSQEKVKGDNRQPLPVPRKRISSRGRGHSSSSDVIKNAKPMPLHKYRNVFGIEGSNNSCYMDSALNSMFLFAKAFHQIFENKPSLTFQTEEVWTILKEEIAEPLNTNKYLKLSTGTISKFRELLATFNASYDGKEMDPDEFICTLFGEILKVPGFYWIEDEETDGSYVFQTYADMTNPRQEIDVQSLLEYSFKSSDIHLTSIPSPGFILKMPVTDGRHMFKKIYPNPIIDLSSILTGLKDHGETKMILSAVICLSSNHFTAFVREGESKNWPWWYLDSFSNAEGEKLSNIDKCLEDQNGKYLEENSGMPFLVSNCYMCFYLPISSIPTGKHNKKNHNGGEC